MTTSSDDLLLSVKDLHAGYGRAEVLHGLNLKARSGSVVTVIGPNGAGKSTLLNALMGVLPARGQVAYAGRSVALQSLEERVMQGMALVPETRALFGTMPVEDNLLLGAYRQVRLGNKRAMDTLEEVFTLFPRLKERRAQLAGTLSGGERQMLAVGRALMSRPMLLMLDEPSLGTGTAGGARHLQDHLGPAGHRRDDPAGRAERARSARGGRLRLRARDG